MPDQEMVSSALRKTRLEPILAGVVVFNPNPVQLRTLVDELRKQATGVVLFLNSALPEDLRHDFAFLPDVSMIEATSNLGIGVGLNILALAACLRGAGGIVFFDQDSTPPSGLIGRLDAAWADLVDAGVRPAVVSPVLVPEPGTISKAPTYQYLNRPALGSARQVSFVPTSGSLVATDVLRRIGFFRADYFIDGIDLEWSFRAVRQGYSCWVQTSCAMPHAVGSGVIGSRRFGWRMPKQRPFRMYCVVRNTVYGLRLGHIPLSWKLKQVAYLPVQTGAFLLHHRLKWSVLKLLLLGVRDGLAARLGPPRGLEGGDDHSHGRRSGQLVPKRVCGSGAKEI
ncbi:glycosyltransferase family 2 protein [Lichenifustis flavocetrariae]|uniref:Rhamnosyltransferase n=1 Tax=Lichenifustis flavocetrariae TaxID=2949735 RepID=A0AA41Z6K1_9HYPH|nr:glycosyltransferase family 2 protein [Lichenifustis flavocetrariae]MCW6511438.1 rhamnosyltransferase [Lichenifustis flavocetrariae]